MSDKLNAPSDGTYRNISRRDFFLLAGSALLGIAARKLEIENPNFVTSSYILNEKAFSKELVGHDVIPSETNDATKVATTYDSGVTLRDVINNDVLPEYHEMLNNEVVDIRWIKSNNNQETAVLTFINGGACVIGYDNNDYPFITELNSDNPLIDMDVLDNHIVFLKTIDFSGKILEEYTQYNQDSFFTIEPPFKLLKMQFDNENYDITNRSGHYIAKEARLIHDNGKLFLIDTIQRGVVKINRYNNKDAKFDRIVQCESLDIIWNIVEDKPMPFVAGLSENHVGIFTTLNNVPDEENNSRSLFFVVADKKGILSVTKTKHSNMVKSSVERGYANIEFVSDKARIKRISEKRNIKLSPNEQIIIVKVPINGSIHEIPWITINETVSDVYEVKELLFIETYKNFLTMPPSIKPQLSQIS